MDSGAAETICPADQAGGIQTIPGRKFAAGVRYTFPGQENAQSGGKTCVMRTAESTTTRNLAMQVADVNRALPSISKAVDAGNRVVFDDRWSYIEDSGQENGQPSIAVAAYIHWKHWSSPEVTPSSTQNQTTILSACPRLFAGRKVSDSFQYRKPYSGTGAC